MTVTPEKIVTAHEPSAEEIDRYIKLENDISRLDYEASIQAAADHTKFQHEIGLNACKSTILVNGGAIIGLLTFVGNKNVTADVQGLKIAFAGFSIGIACTLLGLWLSYTAQNWLSDYRTSVAWNYQQDMKGEPRIHDIERERRAAYRLMIGSSTLVITGIIAFIVGAFFALNAML
jgi:hypothetical protein